MIGVILVMDLNNVVSWDIGDTEVAYYCRKGGGTSRGSLPLFIPKLLPKLALLAEPQPPHILNSSCLANDRKCKPTHAKQIMLQSFITVPIQSNRYFRNPYFKEGAKMYVEIHNKDLDTMYISTKYDESVV